MATLKCRKREWRKTFIVVEKTRSSQSNIHGTCCACCIYTTTAVYTCFVYTLHMFDDTMIHPKWTRLVCVIQKSPKIYDNKRSNQWQYHANAWKHFFPFMNRYLSYIRGNKYKVAKKCKEREVAMTILLIYVFSILYWHLVHRFNTWIDD